jgi:hypothetical protein
MKEAIHNPERFHAEPVVRYQPALLIFLGYNPLPEAKTLGQAIMRERLGRGGRSPGWPGKQWSTRQRSLGSKETVDTPTDGSQNRLCAGKFDPTQRPMTPPRTTGTAPFSPSTRFTTQARSTLPIWMAPLRTTTSDRRNGSDDQLPTDFAPVGTIFHTGILRPGSRRPTEPEIVYHNCLASCNGLPRRGQSALTNMFRITNVQPRARQSRCSKRPQLRRAHR